MLKTSPSNQPRWKENDGGKANSSLASAQQMSILVGLPLEFLQGQTSNIAVATAELRKLAWNGIPHELRAIAWQLLLVRHPVSELTEDYPDRSCWQGYLPAPSARRLPTLKRKRQEYVDAVKSAFSREKDQAIWHQITIDVPRTRPGVRLWMGRATQKVRCCLPLCGWSRS
jgi:hypothetical protein